MDNSTLTSEQLEVIKTLWKQDPEFRKIVEARVLGHALEAQKTAQELFDLASRTKDMFATNGIPKKARAPKCTQKHREVILSIVRSKPSGMTIGEIRRHLDNQDHHIEPKVLNTLLNQYKMEYINSGTKGLRTSGKAPYTVFHAAL